MNQLVAHPVRVVGEGGIAVSARIRPLPGVRPHVVDHLRLHPERLVAHLTDKRQLAFVGQYVRLQRRLLFERLTAQITHKIPLFRVPSQMLLELRFRVELFGAYFTGKVPFVPVDQFVEFQIGGEGELFPTDGALVTFGAVLPDAVLFEPTLGVETAETDLTLEGSIDVAEAEVGLDLVVLVVGLTVLEKGFLRWEGFFAVFGATEDSEFFLELFRDGRNLFVVVGVGFPSRCLATSELADFTLENFDQILDRISMVSNRSNR